MVHSAIDFTRHITRQLKIYEVWDFYLVSFIPIVYGDHREFSKNLDILPSDRELNAFELLEETHQLHVALGKLEG